MSAPVLELHSVAKEYWLAHAELFGLVEALAGPVGRALTRRVSRERPLRAVDGVSLTLGRGEVMGLIGPNGAGKSTLLKLIAGVLEPSAGAIRRQGRVASVLDLSASFHPDLSGRENIFLAAAVSGLSSRNTLQIVEQVMEFADIGGFIDQPMRVYSSGMAVRLGFAVATHTAPDLLLLDEILAVGDIAFQAKCLNRLQEMRRTGTAMLFVSHNLFQVAQVCSRAAVIDRGRFVFDGATAGAIALLEERLLAKASTTEATDASDVLQVSDFRLLDDQGRPVDTLSRGANTVVELTIQAKCPVDGLALVIGVTRSDGVIACNYNSALDGFTVPDLSRPQRLRVSLPPLKLNADTYRLGLYAWNHDYTVSYYNRDLLSMSVQDPFLRRHSGVFHEPAHWVVAPTR